MNSKISRYDSVGFFSFYSKLHTYLVLASLFLQIFIQIFGDEDFFLVIFVSFCALIFSKSVVKEQNFLIAPFPALMVWFFELTNFSVPLVAKSLSLSSLSEYLTNPYLTYVNLSIYQFVAIISLFVFVKIKKTKNTSKHNRLGFLFHWESNKVFYCAGAVGLLSRFFFGGYSEAGYDVEISAASRMMEAGAFLMYLPILIPFRRYFSDTFNDEYFSWRVFWGYLVILLFVAVSRNYRSVFLDGLMLLLVLVILALVLGKMSLDSINKKYVWSVLLIILVAQPLISKVSIAMLVVRDQRTDLSTLELFGATFDVFTNNKLLSEYTLDSIERRDLSGYSEYYVDNQILSRLIMTKFHDNMFGYVDSISDYGRSELRQFVFNRTLGILPNPIIVWLGLELDKESINMSSGDYILFIAEGWGLGGRRTGSLPAEMSAIFGWFSPAVFFAVCIVLFHLYSAVFVARGQGRMIFSPLGLILLWRLIGTLGGFGFNAESFSNVIAGCTRGLVQSVFIYLVVIYGCKYLMGSSARSNIENFRGRQ